VADLGTSQHVICDIYLTENISRTLVQLLMSFFHMKT